MNLRKLISIFLIGLFNWPTQVAAQCYSTFRQDGIDFYNKGKWAEARTQFKEAADCKTDRPENNDIEDWIKKCDKELNKAKPRDNPDQRLPDDDIQYKIQAAVNRASDDSFWEALSDGDIKDCEKYLEKYYNGRHSFEALQRKKMLEQSESKSNQDENNLLDNHRTVFRDCKDCPLMMPVEAGDFLMGDSTSGVSACPHEESVSFFSIGIYEVTVEEYLKFVDATSSYYPHWLIEGNPYNVETGSRPFYYKSLGYSRSAKSLPICGVSREDANAYCRWLSRKTGKKYRLPFEKEWEYAARGGIKSRNCNASTAASGKKPHTVGAKAANELGLYDMFGNLWEWCQDKWYAYPGCIAGECLDCYVMRGGSWHSGAVSATTRNRDKDMIRNDLGFRVVREEK